MTHPAAAAMLTSEVRGELPKRQLLPTLALPPLSAPSPLFAPSSQADYLNLMPAGCRRWTLYNLSVVLCALKCAFPMVRKPGIVVGLRQRKVRQGGSLLG